MSRCHVTIWGLLLLLLIGGCDGSRTLTLSGGAADGTEQVFAEQLMNLLNRHLTEKKIATMRSGGSLVNLRRLERHQVDMALVVVGDTYLALQNPPPAEVPPLHDSKAVARIYGAPAQLVVRASSPAQQVQDLVQSRIAVGSPGSSSALSAQRFFTKLGLWEHITPIFIPTAVGMEELSRGRLEAVWVLGGFPDSDIVRRSQSMPVRLLNLFDAAISSGFFESYPIYAAVRLDAGSYQGQEQDVLTFQDGVVWMARAEVPADYIYRALKLLYSANGRRFMAQAVPVADELDPILGRMGVRAMLHPGAQRFWLEFEERQRQEP